MIGAMNDNQVSGSYGNGKDWCEKFLFFADAVFWNAKRTLTTGSAFFTDRLCVVFLLKPLRVVIGRS